MSYVMFTLKMNYCRHLPFIDGIKHTRKEGKVSPSKNRVNNQSFKSHELMYDQSDDQGRQASDSSRSGVHETLSTWPCDFYQSFWDFGTTFVQRVKRVTEPTRSMGIQWIKKRGERRVFCGSTVLKWAENEYCT